VVGFLFSSNALRALKANPAIPADRLKKLAALQDCRRIVLITAPLTPASFRAANPDAALTLAPAPVAHAGWSQTRRSIRAALNTQKLPSDTILLIGDAPPEQDWATAGQLAGYLPAARYFTAP
jgi:hypothetical protein